MNTLSYWEKSFYNNYDLIIVGSGIVGLSSAIFIKAKNPSWKILILERGIMPYGASTKNAGFACFGSISEMSSDLEKHKEKDLVELVRSRIEGLELLKSLVDPDIMELQNHGGYEIFLQGDHSVYTKYKQDIAYYNEICYKASGRNNTFVSMDLPFNFAAYKKCFYNQYESQLHPAKMIYTLTKKAISEGIHIAYGKELLDYTEQNNKVSLCLADGSIINGNRLLLATNAFTKKIIKEIDVIPQRNQVLITEEIPSLAWKGTFHHNEGYVYFRNVQNRILIGGFRNKEKEEEQTDKFGLTESIQRHLEKFLYNILKVDDKVKVDSRWSGIIATGLNKKPITERISDQVYCAVRLGGMGIAIGAKTGKDISEIIV